MVLDVGPWLRMRRGPPSASFAHAQDHLERALQGGLADAGAALSSFRQHHNTAGRMHSAAGVASVSIMDDGVRELLRLGAPPHIGAASGEFADSSEGPAVARCSDSSSSSAWTGRTLRRGTLQDPNRQNVIAGPEVDLQPHKHASSTGAAESAPHPGSAGAEPALPDAASPALDSMGSARVLSQLERQVTRVSPVMKCEAMAVWFPSKW